MINSELETDLFADRIIRLIDMAGGNSEFARKCDVSESVVRKWRNGESDPSRKRLINISIVMNVSLEWLATGKGQMLPVGAVEHSLETESMDSDQVSLYEVEASAGYGYFIGNEKVIDRIPFKKDWLREIGVKPETCCLINVKGDSMEPTLHDKDMVMLNLAQTNMTIDGVYCIRLDGSLLVKRLQRVRSHKIEVISDNPIYKSFSIDDDFNAEDQSIIGRVVWVGKRF